MLNCVGIFVSLHFVDLIELVYSHLKMYSRPEAELKHYFVHRHIQKLEIFEQ